MYSKEQLLKEWDKIKDFNILESINELEKLFQEKPYGKCMRKYTNYPWNKENFFFGSVEELQYYYRTFTGIPFYLYNRIGQKFHSITILDIFQNDEKEILAKCQCDCGEIVIHKMDSILKGNARSCGCIKGKGKQKTIVSKTYITDINNDFIKKYWDYEKNNIDPTTIKIGDSRNFWWKGIDGSYEMPASCLHAKKAGTSFPEQAIVFFLKSKGVEIEHRKKFVVNGKKYETDIYLPKYNIAIEYDGAMWHREKSIREQEKNNALCSLGIYLIRIRETGLKTTLISKGCEIERNLDKPEDISLSEVINKVFNLLNVFDDSLKLLAITPSEVAKNKPLIHSQYYYFAVEDNINTSWLRRLWSEDNIVPPYMVSLKSNDEFIFKYNSSQIRTSPSKLINAFKYIPKNEIERVSKELMYRDKCPFTMGSGSLCPANCKYHLYNYVETCNYSPFTYLPFDKFVSTFMLKMKTEISLKDFQTQIVSLLEYTKVDYPSIIQEGLQKSLLTDKQKFDYLYNTICYPYMSYRHVNKIFLNQDICSFYLEHCNYSTLKIDKFDLNFTHSENIYAVFACLIHEKNINVLDKVLSFIWQKIEQSKYDNLLYNVFLQFYTKLSYKEDVFFDDKLTKEALYNLLTRNLSNVFKDKIDKATSEDRTAFSKNIYISYFNQLKNTKKLAKESLKFFSARLGHSTIFYDFFINVLDEADIDINILIGYKRDKKQETNDYSEMFYQEIGEITHHWYVKRQRPIDLYRYLIENRLRIGTIEKIAKHTDVNGALLFGARDIIFSKIYSEEYRNCRTKEVNYFELFFEDTEENVHKKLGKYATDIIPINVVKEPCNNAIKEEMCLKEHAHFPKIKITLNETNKRSCEEVEDNKKFQDDKKNEIIYQRALGRINNFPDDVTYKKSIAELESIINYKDSKDQIRKIETLLENWHAKKAKKEQDWIETQKMWRRKDGLCQHCGGSFKKKFLFFTSDICSHCGKKKDY